MNKRNISEAKDLIKLQTDDYKKITIKESTEQKNSRNDSIVSKHQIWKMIVDTQNNKKKPQQKQKNVK